MEIRLFGTVNDSIVDGPGLRYAIFTQGCFHNCLGCHNPKSHDINGGYIRDTSEIINEIDENPLLDGITLSGGEPMLQIEPLKELCKAARLRKLNIVIYSGFTFEQIMDDPRGSSNQRLINIQQSLSQGEVVEYLADENNEIKI